MNATYWGRLIGGRMLEIGDTFGELTVENIDRERAKGHVYYVCSCSCGGSRVVRHNRTGLYKDCGDGVHKKSERIAAAFKKLKISDNLEIVGAESSDKSYTVMSIVAKLRCKDCQFVFQAKYRSYCGGVEIVCPLCTSGPLNEEEDVAIFVKTMGYQLLNIFYGDARRSLIVRCENGHERKVRLSQLKRQPICTVCKPPKNAPLAEERAAEECEKRGFKMLSLRRQGALNYVKVSCPRGHMWEPLFTNLCKDGRGCPECNKARTPTEIFLYLQELTDSEGAKYLKYGLTRNEPRFRMKRQQKDSKMSHEMILVTSLEPAAAIKLEAWLRMNMEPEKFDYKFDGYTEVVSFSNRSFLMHYLSNAYSADLENIEEYAANIRSLCENFSG